MSETVPIRELWYINKRKWLNRFIAAATKLPNMDTEPVSHCEVWEKLPERPFSWETQPKTTTRFSGNLWTSTTRGKANGTVVRPAAGVLDHPENWYYTEHEVKKSAFDYAKAQAQKRRGKTYSWRDLFRYIMPLWLLKKTGVADNGRWICSEDRAQWFVDMMYAGQLFRTNYYKTNKIPSPRRDCKQTVLATGSPLRRLVDNSIVRDGNWVKQGK